LTNEAEPEPGTPTASAMEQSRRILNLVAHDPGGLPLRRRLSPSWPAALLLFLVGIGTRAVAVAEIRTIIVSLAGGGTYPSCDVGRSNRDSGRRRPVELLEGTLSRPELERAVRCSAAHVGLSRAQQRTATEADRSTVMLGGGGTGVVMHAF
jgi:hypothetical protein